MPTNSGTTHLLSPSPLEQQLQALRDELQAVDDSDRAKATGLLHGWANDANPERRAQREAAINHGLELLEAGGEIATILGEDAAAKTLAGAADKAEKVAGVLNSDLSPALNQQVEALHASLEVIKEQEAGKTGCGARTLSFFTNCCTKSRREARREVLRGALDLLAASGEVATVVGQAEAAKKIAEIAKTTETIAEVVQAVGTTTPPLIVKSAPL